MNCNTGYNNTGDHNTGDHIFACDFTSNAGHYNTVEYNTGFFCTETPLAMCFDKPTMWTREELCCMFPQINLPVGKKIQDTFPLVWAKKPIEWKRSWLALPNFDEDKFLTCVGVDVRLDTDLFPRTKEELTIEMNGKKYRLVEMA